MYTVSAVFAILFAVLGLILLTYRLLYMCWQGLPWNNPPTLWTVRWTLFWLGASLFFTLIFTPGCANGCERKADYFGLAFVLSLGIMTSVAIYSCCLCCREKQEDNNMQPEEKQGYDPVTHVDHRPPMSGYDFVFIAVALGILYGDLMLGQCPSRCGPT